MRRRDTTAKRLAAGRFIMALVGAALGGWISPGGATQSIGQVQFSRGGAMAQQAPAAARILGKGSDILLGDTLATEADSFVVIRLEDATKITLRPSSRLAIEAFNAAAGAEEALLHLERGGLQAQAGRIGRSDRDAFRLRTPHGTLRVQGARFNARLCDGDCRADGAQVAAAKDARAAVAGQPVAARIVKLHGKAHAEVGAEDNHPLHKGSPLYPGDTVVTGGRSHLAMAFRDGGRISLVQNTRFAIQEYAYAGTPGGAAASGKASFKMLEGGLRAVTGFIGKGREEDYELVTPVTTIGVRGTGYDSICRGRCVAGGGVPGDGLYNHVWDGTIVQHMAAGDFLLGPGRAAYLADPASPPQLLQRLPPFLRNLPAPRPDRLQVDLEQLFAGRSPDDRAAGVYVYVADGFVALEALELGRGESGYGGPGGAYRLRQPAGFQLHDGYPAPWLSDEQLQNSYSLLKDDATTITEFSCKVK